eukprot:g5283.t1
MRRGEASFVIPDENDDYTVVVVGGFKRLDKDGFSWGALVDADKDKGPPLSKFSLDDRHWTSGVRASSFEGSPSSPLPDRVGYASAFADGGAGQNGYLFVYGGLEIAENEDGDAVVDLDKAPVRNDLLVLRLTRKRSGATEFDWYYDPIDSDADDAARPTGRFGGTLSALADGRVVLVGGVSSGRVEDAEDEDAEDEDDGVWLLILKESEEGDDATKPKWEWLRANLNSQGRGSRIGHTASVWRRPTRDTVVVFGGCGDVKLDAGCRNDVRLISAESDAESANALVSATFDDFVGDVPSARGGHTSIILSESSMLVFGGCAAGECFNDLYELKLDTLDASMGVAPTWRRVDILNDKPLPRLFGAVASLWPQPQANRPRIVISGGCAGDEKEECASVAFLDTQAFCMNVCKNGARYVNGACVCGKGYVGEQCENREDAMPCPNDCSAQGRCQNGVCKCDPGFSGLDCSGACPGEPPCWGRGRCVDETVCECFDGFYDEACSKAHCLYDCSGHGTCDSLTGKCACVAGFDGEGCEREL